MSIKTTGRVVGGLFLSGFVLYGGGSFLLASATDGAPPLPENATSLGQLSAGATLLLLNSAAVAAIGTLAFRVLRRPHHRTARTYLATRTTEAALLALAPLGTLTLAFAARSGTSTDTDSGIQSLARTAVENSESAYWLAMAILGVGSIFFCRALLRSALLPRFLAVWGMVGYGIFALGSALQLAGYGVGLALSAPGGLFEVAVGAFLLVKGFAATASDRVADGDLPATSAPVIVTTTARAHA